MQLLQSMQAAAAHRLNVTESDEVRRLAAMARAALQERLIGIDRSLLQPCNCNSMAMERRIPQAPQNVVEYRGRTGDQGVDLVLSTGGDRIAVQAKCYSGSVGNDAVQQCTPAKLSTNASDARLSPIATSRAAQENWPESVPRTLVDGAKLPDLIRVRFACKTGSVPLSAISLPFLTLAHLFCISTATTSLSS